MGSASEESGTFLMAVVQLLVLLTETDPKVPLPRCCSCMWFVWIKIMVYAVLV